MPTETEAQTAEFAEVISVFTDATLSPVERQDTENGIILTSANGAGEPAQIRLDKEIQTSYGHYYEMVYRFTSNVPGTVRFVCEGAAVYEEDTFDVVSGENEIMVRFVAGESSAIAGLELGALDKFELHITDVACEELTEDLSDYFLDVAPEKAEGTMETTPEGFRKATYKTEEGWRVKLAVDRNLVKGKTYETTFVFLRGSGKDQNVTYTVYDGAATVIGSNPVGGQ
jgi:hypothetical protein